MYSFLGPISGIIIVSGASPYGDYKPMYTFYYYDEFLTGFRLVNQAINYSNLYYLNLKTLPPLQLLPQQQLPQLLLQQLHLRQIQPLLTQDPFLLVN